MPQKKDGPAAPEPESSTTAPEVPDHLLKDIDPQAAAAPAAKAPKKTKTKASKTEQPAPNQTAEAPAEEKTAAADTADTKTTNLDDQATDEAVNDIAVDEGDTMLTLQDVANETDEETPPNHTLDWFVLIVVLIILGVTIFLTRQELIVFYRSLSLNS